ncbi:PIR protein [Plasmodium sp. DRC-Itaito]|nr:PIR protein [Plasmodium sp. DRC-Itaito]
MKVHYINILLFALPLNILDHNKNKSSIAAHHTPKISTTRLLCECDLYIPNYDNDPQMKEVMDNFNKQTQQRFHEYDDRMKTIRQKCKDKCDKESQKIILKDKLEKELMDKFATLHTDIKSDAIPTCICEKSLADKVEKTCLRCGYGLGTVAPTVGLIGSVAVNVLTKAAMAAAAQKGIDAGIAKAIKGVISKFGVNKLNGVSLENIITASNFNKHMFYVNAVQNRYNTLVCFPEPIEDSSVLCFYKTSLENEARLTRSIVANVKKVVADATDEVTLVTKTEISATETASTQLYNAIGYSVLAIVIIILIMVIIYLILRHRRKKKMKKKLQYIKLLEE